MLEQDGALRTWRLEKPPDAYGPIAAEALPDHRLAYLNYEGPVSGGRGTVERWDVGSYELLASESNHVLIRFAGSKIAGKASISREPHGLAWVFRRAAQADET